MRFASNREFDLLFSTATNNKQSFNEINTSLGHLWKSAAVNEIQSLTYEPFEQVVVAPFGVSAIVNSICELSEG